MTAQVTSERIPRHNPTAKPTLNGLVFVYLESSAIFCFKGSYRFKNKASNMVKWLVKSKYILSRMKHFHLMVYYLFAWNNGLHKKE